MESTGCAVEAGWIISAECPFCPLGDLEELELKKRCTFFFARGVPDRLPIRISFEKLDLPWKDPTSRTCGEQNNPATKKSLYTEN